MAGKAEVITWKDDNRPFLPWRFAVTYNNGRWDYIGIPNYCRSKRSAAMRGWWRAKWLESGEHDKRYV